MKANMKLRDTGVVVFLSYFILFFCIMYTLPKSYVVDTVGCFIFTAEEDRLARSFGVFEWISDEILFFLFYYFYFLYSFLPTPTFC